MLDKANALNTGTGGLAKKRLLAARAPLLPMDGLQWNGNVGVAAALPVQDAAADAVT